MSQPHPELRYEPVPSTPPPPPEDLGLPEKRNKPLKPARSQAEITRVQQGKALIFLNCLNVCIASLIALKTFGLI